MDLFSFPPIAALLNAAYALVEGLATIFNPIAAVASAAVAIIVLTMLVRSALIPVGISQVKAEWNRRRIAPKLQALQRKHKKNPRLLQEKTMALYTAEKVSPFAGMLPTLAQAPVLSLVYALFLRTTVDGHTNALLGEHLFGVPLGTSFVNVLGNGGAWPGVLVYLAIFAIMGTVAWMSRRIALRSALPQADPSSPAVAIGRVLSWIPFLTIVFAAFVPLAATLYLLTTTFWTLVERMLLRRRYWRDATPASGARAALAS